MKCRTIFVRHRHVNLLSDLFVNRNLLAILILALELYLAVYESEQGVVLADTDVVARMNVRASLTNENVASQNELTVSALGAKALGLGVAAVLGGAAALFVGEKLKTDVQHGDLPSFL